MNFEQADTGNCNPYYGKGLIGYYTNCQTCVATYFARRLGYDVRALPNLNNKNIYQLSYNSMLAYVKPNGNNPEKHYKPKWEKLSNFLDSNIQEGNIYAFGFRYVGKNVGHIITVEKRSGEIYVYDPQSNTVLKPEEIKKRYGKLERYYIANLSDCKINEQFCDSIMKKR